MVHHLLCDDRPFPARPASLSSLSEATGIPIPPSCGKCVPSYPRFPPWLCRTSGCPRRFATRTSFYPISDNLDGHQHRVESRRGNGGSANARYATEHASETTAEGTFRTWAKRVFNTTPSLVLFFLFFFCLSRRKATIKSQTIFYFLCDSP